jgi:hypothetical protein
VKALNQGHQWGQGNMRVVDHLLVGFGLCKDPNYIRLIELCFTHPDLCKLGAWGQFYEREHLYKGFGFWSTVKLGYIKGLYNCSSVNLIVVKGLGCKVIVGEFFFVMGKNQVTVIIIIR